MPLCYTCKEEKTADKFNKNKRHKTGLQSNCRLCEKKYKEKYLSDPARRIKHYKVSNVAKNERKVFVSKFVNKLKDNPCTDCGDKFHPVAMDFDHLSNKEWSISQMVASGLPLDRIKEELSKCELVCANCHRIRTHLRRSSNGRMLVSKTKNGGSIPSRRVEVALITQMAEY